MKNVSSDSTTNNGQNHNKADKGYGPSRNALSWTSTPDLTLLSDSVTYQIGKLKGKLNEVFVCIIENHVIIISLFLDDEQTIPEYTVRRRTNLSRTDSMDTPSPRNSYNGDIDQFTLVHVNIIITMLIFTWDVIVSQRL